MEELINNTRLKRIIEYIEVSHLVKKITLKKLDDNKAKEECMNKEEMIEKNKKNKELLQHCCNWIFEVRATQLETFSKEELKDFFKGTNVEELIILY